MKNQIDSYKAKKLRFFGRWIVTPLFATGSGVLTVVAVSMLSFIAPLALPYLIPVLILVFLSETIISIFFFKDSVPNTLTNLFVNSIFKDLSKNKKILLGIGIFAALGGGMAVGTTTFMSAITVTTSILGLFSIAFPPLSLAIAAILGLAGFIAITGLFITPIINCIQNDAHKQIRQFFSDLITRNPNKLLAHQILENIFKVLFLTFFVLVGVVGTVATLGTMCLGLSKFLTLIPKANLLAVQIASGIIAFGLMGTARLPWVLQSLGNLSSKLGELLGGLVFKLGYKIAIKIHALNPTSVNEILNQEPFNAKKIAGSIVELLPVIFHGASFGALARVGGGMVLSDIIVNLHLPIPATKVESAGQINAMVSGAAMNTGLSAYSIFSKTLKQAPVEDPGKVEEATIEKIM